MKQEKEDGRHAGPRMEAELSDGPPQQKSVHQMKNLQQRHVGPKAQPCRPAQSEKIQMSDRPKVVSEELRTQDAFSKSGRTGVAGPRKIIQVVSRKVALIGS